MAARCRVAALALGTLVPVVVALADKAIRDPGSNGVSVAVVLIFGIGISVAVSVLFLWPMSVVYRPDAAHRVVILTFFGAVVWIAAAAVLMLNGPFRMRIDASIVAKYLTIAAYGSIGAFAFFATLSLCGRRSDPPVQL